MSEGSAQILPKKIINLDPVVLNNLGGTAGLSEYIIDWSFGQPVSISIQIDKFLFLSSYALQSFINNNSLFSLYSYDYIYDSIDKYIQVYPNPVNMFLYLKFIQEHVKIQSISLYDISGNLLQYHHEQLNNSPIYNKMIKMSYYPVASYFVSIYYLLPNNQLRTKVFKIIKI